MNGSDTEFVDKTAIENWESNISEEFNMKKIILTKKPIEAVVLIEKPDSEPEDDGADVPLNNLVSKKHVVWKWNKRFEKSAMKKCSLAEGGIVNINLENPSLFQVFAEAIGLEGLLTSI